MSLGNFASDIGGGGGGGVASVSVHGLGKERRVVFSCTTARISGGSKLRYYCKHVLESTSRK